MSRRENHIQKDLFGESKTKNLRIQVKELDRMIASAMKKKEYQKAKELTDQQSEIIQELVNLSEEGIG